MKVNKDYKDFGCLDKNMISDFFWYILSQGNVLFHSIVSFVVLSASAKY